MGHDFTVTADTPRSEHAGRHYVFCCPACKPRFDANPADFVG
jgi:YHS domain-containing protein